LQEIDKRGNLKRVIGLAKSILRLRKALQFQGCRLEPGVAPDSRSSPRYDWASIHGGGREGRSTSAPENAGQLH
jgi:hypothetical protein